MIPAIEVIAREVAKQINSVVNLPFINEELEEIFFNLMVTRVLQVTMSQILNYVEKPKPENRD